jgi:hypothetical protein
MLRDADMIGMISLARVSRRMCCPVSERADTVGYAATLGAPVARVGERSMHAVWELDDISV